MRFVYICGAMAFPAASNSVTTRDCSWGKAAVASISLSLNTPPPALNVVRRSIFHVAPMRGANTPPEASVAVS